MPSFQIPLILLIYLLITPNTISGQSATLEQMVGQMILVGVPDVSPPISGNVEKALKEGKAGGIIFFEKNIAPENSAAVLKQLIIDYQKASAFPLLVAIDQEGGKVNRLKPKYGFPESYSATYIGNLHNKDSSMLHAETIAFTLSSLGINLNFAPVVDLCSNLKNQVVVQKERCYSNNPDSVTKEAEIFIETHNKYNILTAIKHFPGHGSSGKDTHREITDITTQWESKELIPYRKLIAENKAITVMTGHVVHCGLDTSCFPATLSKQIVQGLLRDSLKYDGVVFSDDIQMKAISKYYGLDSALMLAINAGVDIIVVANNVKGYTEHQAEIIHQLIMGMIQDGKISEDRIKESYKRIIKLKKRLYNNYVWPE